MKRRSVPVACCVLLSAGVVFAQSDRVADPISGNWGSDGVTFLELAFDGKKAVSGTTIWRDSPNTRETRAAIKAGTFDRKTGALLLEGEGRGRDGAVATYVIEGKLEKDTLAGTFAFGNERGNFSFTKKS